MFGLKTVTSTNGLSPRIRLFVLNWKPLPQQITSHLEFLWLHINSCLFASICSSIISGFTSYKWFHIKVFYKSFSVVAYWMLNVYLWLTATCWWNVYWSSSILLANATPNLLFVQIVLLILNLILLLAILWLLISINVALYRSFLLFWHFLWLLFDHFYW